MSKDVAREARGYELIEAMGLKVREVAERVSLYTKDGSDSFDTVRGEYVRAADLERVLAQAPVVYGLVQPVSSNPNDQMWTTIPTTVSKPTHTARLVCVKPIQTDTAESLLRELLEDDGDYTAIMERARRLLERK